VKIDQYSAKWLQIIVKSNKLFKFIKLQALFDEFFKIY